MKPKVLQLVGSFHQGGSERQAIQLTRLLHNTGRYKVHLACLSPEGSLRQEVSQLGFNDIPAYPLTSFHDLTAINQLRRFIKDLRALNINIVQTHDFYTNVFGMAGATLARVAARVAARRETSGMRTTAQLWTERLSYRFSHAIVANAEAVKQQLISEGVPAGKIVTIHNGLDFERLKSASELPRKSRLELLDLPSDDSLRFVTIVANFRHAVKDHPTFLRAATRVRAALSNIRFILAGEGELLEPMKKMASDLGIASDTFFIGRCERVAELLGISQVCVLSSIAEGFSNTILEYMAAGRPVVVTDVGGAREAVLDGETGFLVGRQDDESMADRIIELLVNSDAAREMGELGRQVVHERFSSFSQLEKSEILYDRLLASAPPMKTTGS